MKDEVGPIDERKDKPITKTYKEVNLIFPIADLLLLQGFPSLTAKLFLNTLAEAGNVS